MGKATSGQKGYDAEELLRAYFLRVGFYVLRGLPLKFEDIDATDVDLWLYERPTGTARRRQIIDAKFKQKPKAIERLFWTRGLAELLKVDGAYVATTDKRRTLRPIANELGLSLIDGTDLERMKQSDRVLYSDRLTEEEFTTLIKQVDVSRRSREAVNLYNDVKGLVSKSFGESLINVSLEYFAVTARNCVTAHENSEASIAYGRLAYFCASVAAAVLDFLSVEEPFKSSDERRQIFTNAVRFGATSKETGTEKLRIATALVRKYAQNGSAIASSVESGFMNDFDNIPAEIIADQVTKMSPNGQLFQSARALEHWSFSKLLPTYDELEARDKSLLGAFLDFSDVNREAFATAWKTQITAKTAERFAERKASFVWRTDNLVGNSPGPLFDQVIDNQD